MFNISVTDINKIIQYNIIDEITYLITRSLNKMVIIFDLLILIIGFIALLHIDIVAGKRAYPYVPEWL